jgi:uncharacterized coiled-coil protein SlyX
MINTLTAGIVSHKKAELDTLTGKVEEAQYQVDHMQAVVDSLTEKSANFRAFLTEAEQKKTTTLNNYNLVQKAKNSLKHLVKNTITAKEQTDTAIASITDTTTGISTLVNKLIFSVGVINTVNKQVVQQKQLNSLIPDQLTIALAKAAEDANNAVATTLTALNTCYAAEASGQESLHITSLEDKQAKKINTDLGSSGDAGSLYQLLEQTYIDAKEHYQLTLEANTKVTNQLSFAQSNLVSATTKLSSLSAGLTAAKSAAFAA